MNKRSLSYLAAISVCLGAVAAVPATGTASDFFYRFDHVFSGEPLTGSPWVEVAIRDVSPGVVSLTVANLMSAVAKIKELDLNLDPAHNPADLVFTLAAMNGTLATPSIGQRADYFKAGGDGYYDIKISFDTRSEAGLSFGGNESLTYNMSGIPGLTASAFAVLNQGSRNVGPFFAAVHMLAATDDNQSVWMAPSLGPVAVEPVPEPSAAALFGLSAIAWVLSCRSGCRTPRAQRV